MLPQMLQESAIRNPTHQLVGRLLSVVKGAAHTRCCAPCIHMYIPLCADPRLPPKLRTERQVASGFGSNLKCWGIKNFRNVEDHSSSKTSKSHTGINNITSNSTRVITVIATISHRFNAKNGVYVLEVRRLRDGRRLVAKKCSVKERACPV